MCPFGGVQRVYLGVVVGATGGPCFGGSGDGLHHPNGASPGEHIPPDITLNRGVCTKGAYPGFG